MKRGLGKILTAVERKVAKGWEEALQNSKIWTEKQTGTAIVPVNGFDRNRRPSSGGISFRCVNIT